MKDALKLFTLKYKILSTYFKQCNVEFSIRGYSKSQFNATIAVVCPIKLFNNSDGDNSSELLAYIKTLFSDNFNIQLIDIRETIIKEYQYVGTYEDNE